MAGLMLQGTGSDVGKSLLVAGLARAFANRGLTVRPFKPQNMSNNAAATVDGGEIGSAQALQARACRVAPHSDMNPVLLKPEADFRSQLIVQGRVCGTLDGRNFRTQRESLLPQVLESYHRLSSEAELVLVEGAGSPAEINLRAGDIANMGFARAANLPCMLVGDINRGGVIAAIVGTARVIDPEDAAMIRGFIINKFRGDPALFADGYRQTEGLSGWRGFGIVPWLAEAARLPSEDGVSLTPKRPSTPARLKIACPVLPRIANFDALDPLREESAVELAMVPPGQAIPADAALIILPDTKSILSDLAALHAEGWNIDILAHHRQGGRVFGIGGGFSMLGQNITGPSGQAQGLGLLDIATVLTADTAPQPVSGSALGAGFSGHKTSSAKVSGPDCVRPFARLEDGETDGAISADHRVSGSQIPGIFANTDLRAVFLGQLGAASDRQDHQAMIDQTLDRIADLLEAHLNVDGLLATARKGV